MTSLKSTEYVTRESPSYGLFSKDIAKSLLTGASLFIVTVASMILMADTAVGSLVLRLYSGFPIIGVLVIGAGLTVGRTLGMNGLMEDNDVLGVIGIAITVLTYGALGSAVLTPFSVLNYLPAIILSSGITTLISIIAGAYVLSRDKSFNSWKTYSSVAFGLGIALVAIGSLLLPSLLFVGFVLFVIGFFCDLVYEIWEMTSNQRSPIVNGFGLYIAFTGIFVHILQIVLEVLSES